MASKASDSSFSTGGELRLVGSSSEEARIMENLCLSFEETTERSSGNVMLRVLRARVLSWDGLGMGGTCDRWKKRFKESTAGERNSNYWPSFIPIIQISIS